MLCSISKKPQVQFIKEGHFDFEIGCCRRSFFVPIKSDKIMKKFLVTIATHITYKRKSNVMTTYIGPTFFCKRLTEVRFLCRPNIGKQTLGLYCLPTLSQCQIPILVQC